MSTTKAMDAIDRYLCEALATDYGACARCGVQQAIGFVVGDDAADLRQAHEVLRSLGWYVADGGGRALCPRCVRRS